MVRVLMRQPGGITSAASEADTASVAASRAYRCCCIKSWSNREVPASRVRWHVLQAVTAADSAKWRCGRRSRGVLRGGGGGGVVENY